MTFSVTENAIKRIAYLLQDEPENSFLRIQVDGGGCNGFQYKFDFDRNLNPDDKIFGTENVKIAIDETSLSMLEGSQFDFVETLTAS
ncbi:MAG: iron-sulfur cluster assembly accessory protein, partial [Rickettsiales bacterium]|nr:iron-sulfur cluster assembly accessory protein [Rickettsiales bacterium]